MTHKVSSIRTVIGRRARPGLARPGLALVIASAGVWAVALPASASPVRASSALSSISFMSGNAVISGAGHKWNVSVTVLDFGAPAFGLSISTPHLGGVEQHAWSSVLPASAVSVSASGVMTMATGSAFSKFATVSLSFKPSSHKSQAGDCSSGRQVAFTGTATGSVTLNTQLKGLKLSGSHLKFGKTSTLTSLGNCVQAPCTATAWDSATDAPKPSAQGRIISFPGQRTEVVTTVENVKVLGKGGEQLRIDAFEDTNPPAPKFTKATKSLSVTTGKAQLVTGAATLAHAKVATPLPAFEKNCVFNGQKYTVTGTTYSKATYDASKPFMARTILNGTITVKPQGPADFDIITLKRK